MDFRPFLEGESIYFVCKSSNKFPFFDYFNIFGMVTSVNFTFLPIKYLFIHTNKFVTGVLSILCR